MISLIAGKLQGSRQSLGLGVGGLIEGSGTRQIHSAVPATERSQSLERRDQGQAYEREENSRASAVNKQADPKEERERGAVARCVCTPLSMPGSFCQLTDQRKKSPFSPASRVGSWGSHRGVIHTET